MSSFAVQTRRFGTNGGMEVAGKDGNRWVASSPREPTVVSWASGRLDVFVVGTDSACLAYLVRWHLGIIGNLSAGFLSLLLRRYHGEKAVLICFVLARIPHAFIKPTMASGAVGRPLVGLSCRNRQPFVGARIESTSFQLGPTMPFGTRPGMEVNGRDGARSEEYSRPRLQQSLGVPIASISLLSIQTMPFGTGGGMEVAGEGGNPLKVLESLR